MDNEANGTPFSGAVHDEAEHDDLPENVYDLERMVSQVPRMRRNSAFHDTLNSKSSSRSMSLHDTRPVNASPSRHGWRPPSCFANLACFEDKNYIL